jgi:hypothetical protein
VKHVFACLAIVGLIWAFTPESNKPAPAPTPAPPSVLSPVNRALINATKVDRSRVTAYYDALADVVSRSKSITTAEGFRRIHSASLDEAFKGTDLPGKYPGLDVAIDEQLVAAIGKDNTGLDGETGKRAALVKALQKVAADAR